MVTVTVRQAPWVKSYLRLLAGLLEAGVPVEVDLDRLRDDIARAQVVIVKEDR